MSVERREVISKWSLRFTLFALTQPFSTLLAELAEARSTLSIGAMAQRLNGYSRDEAKNLFFLFSDQEVAAEYIPSPVRKTYSLFQGSAYLLSHAFFL
jgi:hypothetical protein